MTNADKVKTIFSLVGELVADAIYPASDAETDTAEQTVSAEPSEETEPDPEMWLTVNDLLRLDALQKRTSHGELRQMTRQEFADYRADPASRFPTAAQINGHRKYWQLHQLDTWIDDQDKMSVDRFISQRRAGV